MASGLVPSSFRLARILLDRIEDSANGQVLLESAHTEIPSHRISEARAMADLLGGTGEDFGLIGDLQLMEDDPAEGLLVRCPQTFARVSFLWCFMLLVGVVGPSGGLSRLGFGRVRGVARRAGRGLGRWRCASAGRRAADGSTLCGWGAGSC